MLPLGGTPAEAGSLTLRQVHARPGKLPNGLPKPAGHIPLPLHGTCTFACIAPPVYKIVHLQPQPRGACIGYTVKVGNQKVCYKDPFQQTSGANTAAVC